MNESGIWNCTAAYALFRQDLSLLSGKMTESPCCEQLIPSKNLLKEESLVFSRSGDINYPGCFGI